MWGEKCELKTRKKNLQVNQEAECWLIQGLGQHYPYSTGKIQGKIPQ